MGGGALRHDRTFADAGRPPNHNGMAHVLEHNGRQLLAQFKRRHRPDDLDDTAAFNVSFLLQPVSTVRAAV